MSVIIAIPPFLCCSLLFGKVLLIVQLICYTVIVRYLNCQSEVRIFEGIYPLKSHIKPLIWLFVVKRVYLP
nr:MAG TPA: hypothetical protein [Caudoviricetes sp.]